jgi:hypothetical protein
VVPDFRVYLNPAEWAFVKNHDKGFVRSLVQFSMARAEKERRIAEEARMRQPVREERHETFEEVP